ncbi:MAG: tetratricopeptide repeat protein [Chthoniobacteraceae bacterium]
MCRLLPRLGLCLLALATLTPSLLRGADESDDDAKFAAYPPAYLEAIRSSMRAFEARDFTAARQLVDRADNHFKTTPLTLNIRGAIAIEQKKYDEGRAFCEKALAEDPQFFAAKFNLCEIPFSQQKYLEARAEFETLAAEYPKSDLVKFRIYLTYVLAKDDAGATKYGEQIPFLSDTPVFYYTRAAWEFTHNNPAAAKDWLDRSQFVFPPARHQNFIDVLYDLGWVERPGFGADPKATN